MRCSAESMVAMFRRYALASHHLGRNGGRQTARSPGQRAIRWQNLLTGAGVAYVSIDNLLVHSRAFYFGTTRLPASGPSAWTAWV